jgi:uncharacterized protein
MRACLLDVNVLIARFWPTHMHYPVARRWLDRHASAGWATTPLTQAAFIRIVSNPSFSPRAVQPKEALEGLQANLLHPNHEFWPDDLDFGAACEGFIEHVVGYRQVMDSYLLGLVARRHARIATFDHGMVTLARAAGFKAEMVELLKA